MILKWGKFSRRQTSFDLRFSNPKSKRVSWRTATIYRSGGETVFRNDQLPRTIYLEGNGCGIGESHLAS